ncbi:MAG: hypothetical protein R3E01_22565 [Pirellulaceae bacterium]
MLDRTQVNDLSPLKELKNLKWLSVGSKSVVDVRDLRELTQLEYLDLSGATVPPEQVKWLISVLPNCRIVQEGIK